MTDQVNRSALDALVEIGRAKGEITAHDIRLALPLDQMPLADVVFAFNYLEEAGAKIRLDERFLRARPDLARWLLRSKVHTPASRPFNFDENYPERTRWVPRHVGTDWVVATSAALVLGLYVSAHLIGYI
jgi:hypothetical protein